MEKNHIGPRVNQPTLPMVIVAKGLALFVLSERSTACAVFDVKCLGRRSSAMENGANPSLNKSFRDWLSEGEALYAASVNEFNSIEAQIDQLEQLLAAKKAEVNQIAHVIGKPPVEGGRRLTAQIIEPGEAHHVNAAPAGNMARALSGRGINGRM